MSVRQPAALAAGPPSIPHHSFRTSPKFTEKISLIDRCSSEAAMLTTLPSDSIFAAITHQSCCLTHPLLPLLAVSTRSDLLWSIALCAVVSLATGLLTGPLVIRWLRRNFQERIHSDSTQLNTLHAGKSGTPTMGGILILFAFICGLLVIPGRPLPAAPGLLCIGTALTFGALGAIDDLIKARTHKKGLTIRQKLCSQIVLAGIISIGIHYARPVPDSPTDQTADAVSSLLLFVPWSTIVLVAMSNAVNLTDGLDGLAAGCLTTAAAALAWILAGHTETQALALPAAALAGSTLSFLGFNRYPARVFMGDTGALASGAVLATIALLGNRELLLPICGSVFLIETTSVIAQVVWFRRTKTRLLLCSPLHNHFVFRKVPEPTIVYCFWAVSCVSAVIAGICLD